MKCLRGKRKLEFCSSIIWLLSGVKGQNDANDSTLVTATGEIRAPNDSFTRTERCYEWVGQLARRLRFDVSAMHLRGLRSVYTLVDIAIAVSLERLNNIVVVNALHARFFVPPHYLIRTCSFGMSAMERNGSPVRDCSLLRLL